MKAKFRLAGPEVAGLAIVGATIGGVLCGAADSALTAKVAFGALAGGAGLPALFLIRWLRMFRILWRQLLRAPTKAPN